MGNDHSKLKGLEIKEIVESTDFWILCNAEIPNENSANQVLSIFKEEAVIPGQLWVTESPLRRLIKNLMIYRHPYILKYITSWDQGSYSHLAIENVRPLNIMLQSQSDIQICLGLRNILCSLMFLIEQAKARHLNICISSIYVSIVGEWRLGGFEYVWKSKDLTKTILDLAKSYRYRKAIDPNESKNPTIDNLEQYSFGVLCEEILKTSKNIETPYISEFRDYCLTHLKHINPLMRPKLSAILLHPYFNHEFILIHSFLTELPLKNPQEKQDFFTGLIDRLRYFDEIVVAAQVGNLLLSRMVLLDTTAQLCVTPYVLKTKTDISSALFGIQTFKKYIIPQIKKIFFVRDTQIRLILLEHFNEYIKLLTQNELQDDILPNLLLGIKDTNDILVAKTLKCLADLVPILGSKIVIGGNRSRLFADGRPQRLPSSDIKENNWIEAPRSITPVLLTAAAALGNDGNNSPLPDHVDLSESLVSIIDNNSVGGGHDGGINIDGLSINNHNRNTLITMPERLSPDGIEDTQLTPNATDIEGDDPWSDWENDDLRITTTATESDIESIIPLTTPKLENSNININNITTTTTTKTISDDINDLDIKIQKINNRNKHTDEIDFFKDMEPVIKKPPKDIDVISEKLLNNMNSNNSSKNNNINYYSDVIKIDNSRFDFKIQEEQGIPEAGWGDEDDNDWCQ